MKALRININIYMPMMRFVQCPNVRTISRMGSDRNGIPPRCAGALRASILLLSIKHYRVYWSDLNFRTQQRLRLE